MRFKIFLTGITLMMILDVYIHTHSPVDSALRAVAAVYIRSSLVGVHDVIQCGDWLIRLHHSRYVVRYTSSVMPTGTRPRYLVSYLEQVSSTVFHTVQRGINSQLSDCKSSDQKPRSAFVNRAVCVYVDTEYHHHMLRSRSL